MKNGSVIKAKILRLRLGSKASKFFDELEIEKQEIIKRNLEYLISEDPIFTFFDDVKYWWIITNQRLLINENGIVYPVLFKDIVGINVKEIFEGNATNEDCERIQVLLKNGIEVNLRVEKNTWFSVFNLFKFLSIK